MCLDIIRFLCSALASRKSLRSKLKRRAITPIVAVVLLILISFALAVSVYAYVTNVGGVAGSGISNLFINSGDQISEQLKVEQTYFNLSSSGQKTSYVIVTFTNFQGSATSAPFQQMFTFNPSLFTSLEAPDLGNIRFYQSLSGGTFSGPIDAWLESVSGTPANQATSATFWLSLSSGIPASSQVSVYMDFLPTTTEFDGIVTGEAAQLSSVFGQYDNGNNVFLYYNNGSSLSSLSLANGGTLSVSTQTNPFGSSTPVMSLTGPGSTGTSSETVAWINSALIGNNFMAEGWVNIATNLNGLFAVRGSSSSALTNYLVGDGWSGDAASITYESGTTNTLLSGNGARSAGWYWDAATVNGTLLNATVYSKQPYLGGSLSETTSASDSTLGAGNQYDGIATWSGSTSPAYFFEWRVRDYPPNGVMPSTSIGTISTVSPSQAGADLYVRNFGTSSLSISAVYVQIEQNGSLAVADRLQSPITVQSGSVATIPVGFTPVNGFAYDFIIVTELGSEISYVAVA